MIADQYLQLRADLEKALAGLLRLASEMRREPQQLDTLQGLLNDIREPLLIVVVGEVKAGKSSLLNALFGQEFAKVDVLPATDRIYIFRHAPEEKNIEVSPQLTERYLPVPFLLDFNVVDTPGTNTMVAEHHKITENFVPRADVVLFVFSVTNPWTQSAWDLLGFVQKKWLKNVVFVVQQADLREPAEIEVIQRHVKDTAIQKLGFAPPIFAISARKALLAQTTGIDKERLWQESGFGPLTEQINFIISESGARVLKLRSISTTAGVLLDEIAAQLRDSFEVLVNDEERIERIGELLQARKDQTLRQLEGFLRGVSQACRDCAVHGVRLLQEQLAFWRTWKIIWGKSRWQHQFQSAVEIKLRESIQPQIENAVQLLESDLRGVWPQLQDTIDTQFGSELKTQVTKIIPDFARQRREVLQSIQLAFAERASAKSVENKLEELIRETSTRLRLPAGVAAAGGLVALITAMSSAAVADVTGVVAASAAVLGAFVAFSQRRKIIRAYEEQMEAKGTELMETIERQLEHAIELFYKEISAVFQPLAAFCTTQRQRYEPLLRRADQLRETLQQLQSRLGETE